MAPPTFAEVQLAAEIAAFKRSLGMNAETEKPLVASFGSGVMARVWKAVLVCMKISHRHFHGVASQA